MTLKPVHFGLFQISSVSFPSKKTPCKITPTEKLAHSLTPWSLWVRLGWRFRRLEREGSSAERGSQYLRTWCTVGNVPSISRIALHSTPPSTERAVSPFWVWHGWGFQRLNREVSSAERVIRERGVPSISRIALYSTPPFTEWAVSPLWVWHGWGFRRLRRKVSSAERVVSI